MVPGLDLYYTRWSGTYLVKHEKHVRFRVILAVFHLFSMTFYLRNVFASRPMNDRTDTRAHNSIQWVSRLREVWSRPKFPLFTSLVCYRVSREFLSSIGDSEKKNEFSPLREGHRSWKHVGVNFDSPKSQECMVADLAVLCGRKQLSQNSGSP